MDGHGSRPPAEQRSASDRGSRCSPRPLTASVRLRRQAQSSTGFRDGIRMMASGRSDKRVGLIAILALCVLGRASAAEPQEAGRQYQVGLVTLATSPSGGGLWSGLIEAMRELNYVEGRNLVVRRASAEGKPDRLPGLVAELVKSQVDVLVTTATRETVAAKRAT